MSTGKLRARISELEGEARVRRGLSAGARARLNDLIKVKNFYYESMVTWQARAERRQHLRRIEFGCRWGCGRYRDEQRPLATGPDRHGGRAVSVRLQRG